MVETIEELYLLAERYALEFLIKGREDWDVPHTKAVFYYAKLLTEASGQDMAIIPTAAWLHDIGYFGTFEHGSSSSYQEVQDRKIRHMKVGAEMTRTFINREDVKKLISSEQGERIVDLVLVHDNYSDIKELDETILMEADTFGAIDIGRIKPTFNYIERMKFYENELKTIRIPMFRTELGKKILEELLPKYLDYKN